MLVILPVKDRWVAELTLPVMGYKLDPAKSWQAMYMLEAGLCHHLAPCHTACMKHTNGDKATTDKENAEVFTHHFAIFFNNPNPLPCDDSVLHLVPQCQEFTQLANPPMHNEVADAILCMWSGKAPGPTGVTSNAFCAMIW
eukprot:7440618-Ditylum_brightwellii.AAC.1